MPRRASKPCGQPGCPKLVESGYCDKHRNAREKRDRERRGTAASRGYGYRWQKARLAYLKRHPLCECPQCKAEELLRPATVVDHIVPHKGDMKVFWDSSNWQAMCKECHDRKTAKEDGAFGNRPSNGRK